MPKTAIYIFILFLSLNCRAQQNDTYYRNGLYLNSEILLGVPVPVNQNSPFENLQKTVNLSFSKKNYSTDKKWAFLLNYPTTGLTLSYTNFVNESGLSNAISIAPFIEYNLSKSQYLSRWSLKSGLGVSFFNKIHNPLINPDDKAIVTHFNITYNLFLYYQLFLSSKHPIKLGGGYIHHSNGHIKLPNLGINSGFLSISSDIPFSSSKTAIQNNYNTVSKSYQTFFEFKTGLGYQDFLIKKHDKKNVISLASSIGYIYKDTYKLGIGIAYRKYQHYYDYIVGSQLEDFNKKPNLYASNFLAFFSTEVLMDHIGINIDAGINLYKPFYETHYKIQWREKDFRYKLKKNIMGRMGLKFYVNNTRKLPANNLFLGAHINSNSSQADFFEYSLGFTHRLSKKKNQKPYTKLILRDL